MLRHLRKSCSVIALLVLIGAANAEPRREQSLAEMDHRAWTARDGAPQSINALAQGADGTLWIGADAGLFNFDGRTFSAFRSPAGQPDLPIDAISSLLVTRDGTLWVGFFTAGIARIGHGHVSLYSAIGEQQLDVVRNLREARDGSIWGARQRRIVRFGADEQWHEEPSPVEGEERRLFAVLDSTDTLWVAQRGRLYRRDIRESRYAETNVAADWLFGLAEAGDGTFWIADYDGAADEARLQHVDPQGRLIGQGPIWTRMQWPFPTVRMARSSTLRRTRDCCCFPGNSCSAPLQPIRAFARKSSRTETD